MDFCVKAKGECHSSKINYQVSPSRNEIGSFGYNLISQYLPVIIEKLQRQGYLVGLIGKQQVHFPLDNQNKRNQKDNKEDFGLDFSIEQIDVLIK